MKERASVILLVLAVLVALIAGAVQNQEAIAVAKTIVVPNDSPTIAAALNAAVDGDTIYVKKGTYREHTLMINKSVSLMGEDAQNTVLENVDPEFRGAWPHLIWNAAIEVQTNHITISNLKIALTGGAVISIVGNGNGTTITRIEITSGRLDVAGSDQIFESNRVNGTAGEYALTFIGAHNYIYSNTVTGTSGGIYTSGSNNVISNNTLTSESYIGAQIAVNGNQNLIANNNLSSFAILKGELNTVCGNRIDSNLAITGNNNTFYANVFEGIILGSRVEDASNNLFYHNNFVFNQNSFLSAGEKTFTVWEGVREISFFDNGKEGNFWSDYNGTDEDGNGIGDVAYLIKTNDPINYDNVADFNIANLTFTDNYPCTSPFNISKNAIPLPDWVTEPPATPKATPNATLTPPPTHSATLSPTPTSAPSPSIPEFPTCIILPLLLATFVLARRWSKKIGHP